MTAQSTVHVALSTHWDREWVQSFEQYRFRLVELCDRMLDILEAEPELVFVFDGQCIVIEDFLAVRPEQEPRLRRLAQRGQVVFGPWFILADQFLEGDEATVRNLLIGRAISAGYGGAMAEGYVPDSFGSLATLPMILAGFSIRYANMGRGVPKLPDGKRIFRWGWRDGSQVLALAQGYGSALSISYHHDQWRNMTKLRSPTASVAAWAEQFLATERPFFPGSHVYGSAGHDHMELRGGVTAGLAAASARTGARWISSTPQRFLEAVEAEGLTHPRLEGEMRGDRAAPMDLQGVLGTDAILKRANRRCELLLSRLLEPLEVAHRLAGQPSRRHVLRRAWKLLLANHPHDTICACSTDATMQDIHARMRRVGELAGMASERWLNDVVPQELGARPRLAVFNPLPGRGRAVIDTVVRVPGDLPLGMNDLVDAAGARVGTAEVLDHRVIDCETFYATNADLLAMPSKPADAKREPGTVYSLLRVRGSLDCGDAAGLELFTLAPVQPRPALAGDARSLDNGLVRIEVATDGRVTLTDHATGRRFGQLGWFEDVADAGDTYDVATLKGDVPLRSWQGAPVSTRLIERTAERTSLEVTTRFSVPRRLAAGCSRRERRVRQAVRPVEGARSAETVEITLVSTWTLHAGIARAEVVTRFDNRADHHRLRLAVASTDRPALTTGAHFAALERPWSDPADPFPCRPVLDWMHRGDGLAILVEGIYEVEPRRLDDGGELLFPLCRSVDTIGPGAGCNFDVEHARALGPQEARYAFAPAATPLDAARAAQSWLAPLAADGLMADAAPPIPQRLLACAEPGLLVTAIKRAEADDGVVVRLLNLGPVPLAPRLETGFAHQPAEVVGLDEEPRPGAPMQAPAYGLLTLKLRDPRPA